MILHTRGSRPWRSWTARATRTGRSGSLARRPDAKSPEKPRAVARCFVGAESRNRPSMPAGRCSSLDVIEERASRPDRDGGRRGAGRAPILWRPKRNRGETTVRPRPPRPAVDTRRPPVRRFGATGSTGLAGTLHDAKQKAARPSLEARAALYSLVCERARAGGRRTARRPTCWSSRASRATHWSTRRSRSPRQRRWSATASASRWGGASRGR